MYKREVERLLKCIEEEKLKALQKEQYARELYDKLKQYFTDNAGKIQHLTELTGRSVLLLLWNCSQYFDYYASCLKSSCLR